MNNLSRILKPIAILTLLLALAVVPPIMAGWQDLLKAENLKLLSPGQAALEYESAAKRLAWRTDLWEKAGLLALLDDNPGLAVRMFEKAPHLTSTGRLALGDALYRAGSHIEGVEVWEQMREEGLGSSGLYNRLGHAYLERGNYGEAIDVFDIAQKLDLNDSDSRYMLGLLLATRNPQFALEPLIQAAKLDPALDPVIQELRHGLNVALLATNPAAQLTGAGRTLVAQKAWTLAKEAFSNAVKADPQFAPAWAWMGEVKQAFHEDGLPDLDRALTLDPNSSEIRGLRAIYWMRVNRFEKAREDFQAAADLEPLNPGWQVSLGDVIARTGDVPDGLKHYQHAIELSPRDPVYWRLLANFTVDYNYGVQEIGFPAALQARALASEDIQNIITLGRVYFASGDKSTAENLWLQSVENSPDIPAGHLYLGILYLQEGNNDAAYNQLVSARDLDPVGPYGGQAQSMLDQYFP
jgi:tetratricopeptide (TPR) repeat protein